MINHVKSACGGIDISDGDEREQAIWSSTKGEDEMKEKAGKERVKKKNGQNIEKDVVFDGDAREVVTKSVKETSPKPGPIDRKGSKINDANSMDLLLSGAYTKGWKAQESREVPDDVSPNTLITDHPEAVLREGRVINYFECPDCGFMIEVTTKERPLEIFCASCRSRFRLKGKKKEEPEIPENTPAETETDWDLKAQLSEEAMKYHRRGDLNRAVEVYDKILEISNIDPVVWNNKGVALDDLGMHILAIKCYEKAIQLRDSYVDAWFNYAYSQYQMKQFEKAIESLRMLVRLKPDHKEGNQLLEKCEEELKTWKAYL